MAAAYLMAPNIHVEQRCRYVPWPSRQKAQQRVRRASQRAAAVQMGSGTWSAYVCKVCKAWHIGHRG